MDMNDNDNVIMPPSVALTFFYSSRPICSVPVFILVLLARNEGVTGQNQYLNALNTAPDLIADGGSHLSPKSCLKFLQETIAWDTLAPHLSCPDYLREPMGALWSDNVSAEGPLSIHIRRIAMPDVVYRYMTFRHDRASQLLEEGRLFMPCPAMFNDPFDCSLDEATRLTFIEAAIGCFSTVPDDVLMFSHYADNHRGFAVGFDTRLLIGSLTHQNRPLRADIRPVWYFPTMPKLDLLTQPALCATCKSDIWRYENEFRIFMANGSALAPSNVFALDRNAIVEVICGCKAPDDTVAACKSLTDDLFAPQDQRSG
jgi:hypothetical protein